MTLNGEQWFARITPGTDPTLPPVVMVHGLIVSGAYFRPVANVMDLRHPTYIPDLPGIGRTSSSTRWTLPLWTEHLAGWMDAHGLSGAILVGNSLGCQIATLLAVTRPDLARALILIAPTLDPEITSPLQVIGRGIKDIPHERPSIWSVWIPDFLKTGVRRSLSMLHEMFRDDQLARLAGVTQPALVIGGEIDPIVTPDWVRDMASRIPRGEAIIVPEAPHALNYSAPRDLVAAIDRAANVLKVDLG
jgi:pimeloyl-ACP methyl ester carboxylesterase